MAVAQVAPTWYNMPWLTVSPPTRPATVIVAVAGANASLPPKSSVPTEPLSAMS